MITEKSNIKKVSEKSRKMENEAPFRFAYPYFASSNICVIAGRAETQKTEFAINFGKYIANKEKKNIAYFTFSDFKIEIEERFGKTENIEVIDTVENICDLVKICRELKASIRVDVIMIDTIQSLAGGAAEKKKLLRKVQKIVKTLKMLSEELSCPVMILSQFGGNGKSRKARNIRPPFLHLSEMGIPMKEIDNLFFLYRETYDNLYNKDKTFLECNMLKAKINERTRIRFVYENDR